MPMDRDDLTELRKKVSKASAELEAKAKEVRELNLKIEEILALDDAWESSNCYWDDSGCSIEY